MNEKIFCNSCGTKIKKENTYCPKCGKGINEDKIFCVKCGVELNTDQTFCSKCGKKIRKNKVLIAPIIIAMVCIILVGGFVGYKILEKTNYNYYLVEGNYQVAYDKAKEDKKDEILLENLIAVLSLEVKNSLKIEESFKLIGVWWDGKSEIVLKIQGENNVGGKAEAYYHYHCENEEIVFFSSDFQKKDEFRFDNGAIIDLPGAVKYNNCVRYAENMISNNSLRVDNDIVERINVISNNRKLQEVILMDEVFSLFE